MARRKPKAMPPMLIGTPDMLMVQRIPHSVGRKLRPTNPLAPVTWYRVLNLADAGKLVETCVTELQIKPNAAWLKAFALLEAAGLRRGITAREVAAHLGCTPKTAYRNMLAAEKQIYELFGLNICFFDNNGRWKLITENEALVKYARMFAELAKKAERMRMYAPHAAALCGPSISALEVPLFDPAEARDYDDDNAAD